MMSGALLARRYWEVEHARRHQTWTTWREELESEYEVDATLMVGVQVAMFVTVWRCSRAGSLPGQ